MNKLFWGFFFIFLNFSLNFNGASLQLLPDWLGFILLYLGYGYKTTKQALMPEAMRRLEGLALVIYVVLAMAGIVYAGQFCQNFAFNNGHIGELHSAGTIAFMDEAVAFNVVTGSIVLGLGMLGLLLKQDEES